MKIFILALIISVTIFGSSSVGLLIPGQCPDDFYVPSFDFESYLGKWYEIKRYENVFQLDGDCVMSEYYDNGVGNTFGIRHRMIDLTNGTVFSIDATAVVAFPRLDPIPAILNYTVTGDSRNLMNYFILATDYGNYSIVYKCQNYPDGYSIHYAWILARMQILNDEILAEIDTALTQIGFIDPNRMRITNQSALECV